MPVVGAKSAFGSFLRELRKSNGITSPAELAARTGGAFSVSGILKRERGELKISKNYVEAFLRAVPVSTSERLAIERHFELFQAQFELWSGDESVYSINLAASERLEQSLDICCYSPILIPHILQNPEYTRAVLATYEPGRTESNIVRIVGVRGAVAARILNEDFRKVRLLNAEAALHNRLAEPNVMKAQLKSLLNVVHSPHIQYRIIPMDKNTSALMDGTFTIYDTMFVCAESTIGNLYTGDQGKVDWAVKLFERLWAQSATPFDSQNIILSILDRLHRQES